MHEIRHLLFHSRTDFYSDHLFSFFFPFPTLLRSRPIFRAGSQGWEKTDIDTLLNHWLQTYHSSVLSVQTFLQDHDVMKSSLLVWHVLFHNARNSFSFFFSELYFIHHFKGRTDSARWYTSATAKWSQRVERSTHLKKSKIFRKISVLFCT